MSVCQIMLEDFLYKSGQYDIETGEPYYIERDLQKGLEFCEWALSLGNKECCFPSVNAKKFIKWAKHKLLTLHKGKIKGK